MTNKPGPDWLTKQEVAAKLGKGLSAVTRLTTKGLLNPLHYKEEGEPGPPQNRYDPQEVAEVLSNPKLMAHTQNSLDEAKEDLALYQLDTVKAIVGLVREPREKIDQLQFDIIKDLRAENKELREEIKTMRADVEAARDNSAERQIGIEMVKNDQAIKKLATERVLTTLGKLISGPDGVQLSPDQWEELIIANNDGEKPFLTEEQVKKGKEIVARAKASSNGKGVVEAVKKTVVDTAGIAAHD